MFDLETLKANLIANGYVVRCFVTAEEAADYLDAQIDQKSVGFGGSMTLKQMGLYARLNRHNTVYWHWEPGQRTDAQCRQLANAAQIYLSSVNGLAMSGEIVNIDGRCNRVASIVYGHEKVYLIAGENKIEADAERALHRARNIAAPRNAQRLGVQTPCAVKGERCFDCSSPQRICKGLSILWEAPIGSAVEVVLIREDLGY